MRIRVSAGISFGAALGAFTLGSPAIAQSGTHAPAVSTYDTRASSIVFAYRHGFSTAGSFNTFSYNANFTSTTGRLSAQFGIHYVNYKESGHDTRAHGVAGSGVAVLEYPVAGRWEDGVPKAALALHLGGVPTAYISGERNFLTVPFVLGFGVPLSPHRVVTFTPWYELAIAANVNTIVRPEGVTIDSSSVVFDPQTQTASLKPGAVETALRQGVTIDVGVTVPMRAGLQGTVHLGRGADLDLYGMLSTLGGAFSGASVKTVGAALVVRWDDIVPAVLPKKEAEPAESCESIERRFRACPSSRHWLTPEQRGKPTGEAPPGAKPPAAGAAPAVSSSPPAPAPAPPLAPAPAPPAAAPPAAAPPAAAPPAAVPPPPSTSPPANDQFPPP